MALLDLTLLKHRFGLVEAAVLHQRVQQGCDCAGEPEVVAVQPGRLEGVAAVSLGVGERTGAVGAGRPYRRHGDEPGEGTLGGGRR